MAHPSPQSVNSLKALTYRLTTTPPEELPCIAGQISASIWNCRNLLSWPAENKQSRETIDILKRFHTRLTSLLQDRTIHGRWAAVVLVKAAIEAGGLEVLSKCNSWVRLLHGFLKKPDPPTTRSLTIITLTRIFMLTWDYSNLVREITTPALTSFIPTCLSNLENKNCSASERQTILESFVSLIARHHNIFRTHEAKLRTILSSVLSDAHVESGLSVKYSGHEHAIAERLLVLLHHCAPKQGGSEKWSETMKMGIQASHATCDQLFRAVLENSSASRTSGPIGEVFSGEAEIPDEDAAGLKPWKGIYAGADRLIELLRIVEAHLTTATTMPVSVQTGTLMALLARIFSVTVPLAGKQDASKINNQISKDEREALYAVLPSIHVAALRLTARIYDRLGAGAIGLIQTTLEQILPVFRAEDQDDVRGAVFALMEGMIDRIGLTMTKNEVSDLAPVLKSACLEVLPNFMSTANPQVVAGGIKQQLGLSGGQVSQTYPTSRAATIHAAHGLLCTSVRRLDAALLPPQLRANIDRVAVLTENRETLLASVMNPAKKHNDGRLESSLMPILARQFGDHPHSEALIRPRMPPVRAAGRPYENSNRFDEVEEGGGDEEEEEEEEDEAEVDGMEDIQGENIDEKAQPSPILATLRDADDASRQIREFPPAVSEEGASSKRRAVESAEAEIYAKRVKPTTLAETLLPESTQSLPGPDPMSVQAGAPITIESSQATFTTAVPDQFDVGDDSDLEIPDINPDPDTDPEDVAVDSE